MNFKKASQKLTKSIVKTEHVVCLYKEYWRLRSIFKKAKKEKILLWLHINI